MYLGNHYISNEKWNSIYESYGIPRKNGYISTVERIKAKKKNRKKK